MKRFTKQVSKFKEVLLSYSNRTIKSKSPDFWVLWYCTPDFTELGERLRCLRRADGRYGVTREDREYRCSTHENIDIESAEMYSVYVVSITLWKADDGEEKSQCCH